MYKKRKRKENPNQNFSTDHPQTHSGALVLICTVAHSPFFWKPSLDCCPTFSSHWGAPGTIPLSMHQCALAFPIDSSPFKRNRLTLLGRRGNLVSLIMRMLANRSPIWCAGYNAVQIPMSQAIQRIQCTGSCTNAENTITAAGISLVFAL